MLAMFTNHLVLLRFVKTRIGSRLP